ncbi:MAG: GNAT family N-acetyltransferase [Spirochaetaceae bacterium]|nr:GNAT family N-acetyltransferase [Spirochaetaceae bacterium]
MDKNNLPAVLKLAREVIAHNYASFLDKDAVSDFLSSKQCDREIIEHSENCVVMTVRERVTGFALLVGNTIHALMIARNHQRKKHGSALLRHIERILSASHAEITLDSFARNSAANSFYEKNGWRKAGETQRDGITLYHYKKSFYAWPPVV